MIIKVLRRTAVLILPLVLIFSSSATVFAADPPPTPDFVANTLIVYQDEIAILHNLDVFWAVSNAVGAAPAGIVDGTLYLGTDINPHAIQLTSYMAGPEYANSYGGTTTVWIPQVERGQYYIVLEADGIAVNGMAEKAEDKNNNTYKVRIKVIAPDLVPTSFSCPVAVSSQSPYPGFTWSVQNQGDADMPEGYWGSWTASMGIYRDSARSDYAGSVQIGGGVAIAAGSTYYADQSVTVPGILQGTYYVFLSIAAPGIGYEDPRDNNLYQQPRVIQIMNPDLIPRLLEAPIKVSPGQQGFVSSFTVENQGAGRAGVPWADALYLSRDDTLDRQSDMLVYSGTPININMPLTPLSAYTQTVEHFLWWTPSVPTNHINPQTIPAGDYHLFVVPDYTNTLYESNESNNIALGGMDITVAYPDLVPLEFNAPAAFILGQPGIQVSWTVQNQDSGDCKAWWYDRIYLSADDKKDANDIRLTEYVANFIDGPALLPGGNPGGSYRINNRYISFQDVPTGKYYLILSIDDFKDNDGTRDGPDIPETDENNNIIVRPFEIKNTDVDLEVTGVTVPGTGVIGQPVTISWTVENNGPGYAPQSWYDNVWLSTDVSVQETDFWLGGDFHTSGLDVNKNYTTTISVNLPPNLSDMGIKAPPGNYYLIIEANGGHLLPETDQDNSLPPQDANNVLAKPIVLKAADLVPTGMTAPTSVLAKQQVSVSWTVANQGNADAIPSWTDDIYFSTENVINAQAVLLRSVEHSAGLVAGGAYQDTATVAIPDVSPGNYYIIIHVSTDQAANAEYNQDNNVFVLPVTLVAGAASSLTISAFPSNAGTTTPVAGTYSYSRGTVVPVSAAAALGWHFSNWTGPVANANAPSTTVTVDADKSVVANFALDGAADLVVTEKHEQWSAGAGNYTVSFTVKNNGSAASLPSRVGLRIDNALQTQKVEVPSLAAGASFSGTFPTPIIINGDSDEVIVVADIDNQVIESDENNNTRTNTWNTVMFTLTMGVNPVSRGTTIPAVGAHSYVIGTTVAISTQPISGWQFVNWTGAVADGNSINTGVVMNSNKTVTANFERTEFTPIQAIKSDPIQYENLTVKIQGTYRGWESGHGSPPVSRSDWVLQDAGGAIYVTGNSLGLRYPDNIGRAVTVEGVIKIKDGVPYLQIPAGPDIRR